MAATLMLSGLGATPSATESTSAANPDSGRLRQITSDTEIKVHKCSHAPHHLSIAATWLLLVSLSSCVCHHQQPAPWTMLSLVKVRSCR